MCSIISFGNVRMSGMGKNLVTSYAALGVGLAIMLTFGLTAISSIMEQPSEVQFVTSQPESGQMVPAVPLTGEPAPPSEAEDVSAKASAPAEGGIGEEAMIAKAPARQEAAESLAAEVPPTSSLSGFLMVLPYIAAAAVGSVVFVVTRKRVGW